MTSQQQKTYTKTLTPLYVESSPIDVNVYRLNNRKPNAEYIWLAEYYVDLECNGVIGASKTLDKAIKLVADWLAHNSYASRLLVTETELV